MAEEHKTVREILARIEANQTAQTRAIEVYQEQMSAKIDNHGRRLISLEVTRTWAQGALAVAGLVGAVIWHKVQDKFQIGGR